MLRSRVVVILYFCVSIYLQDIYVDKNPDECQIKGGICLFNVGYIALCLNPLRLFKSLSFLINPKCGYDLIQMFNKKNNLTFRSHIL